MHDEWFAGRLRELREAAGLSRVQLAGKAGLSAGGVRDLEQGHRRPSWETVLRLCGALGVHCDAFTTRPKPHEPSRGGRPKKTPPAGGAPPGKRGRGKGG